MQTNNALFTSPIFYYAMSGIINGPCSLKELEEFLRGGILNETTTIWHKGSDTASLQVL